MMPPPLKRQRRDLAAERPAWVRGNVGEAMRSERIGNRAMHVKQQQGGTQYRLPGMYQGAHHRGRYGGPRSDRGSRGGRGNGGRRGERGGGACGDMSGSQGYGGGGRGRGGYPSGALVTRG